MAAPTALKSYPQTCPQLGGGKNTGCVIFPAYPLVLAIDATAARRHFAALLLYWPNGILTCLLRAKGYKNSAFHQNGRAFMARVGLC